ncbi:MAG TPA: glycosyltransferase family 4 protein [Dehalococcoidia bacterium]|nr:glycosyltransferase family 4 protein [Dehalococcoidia bacterium]
MIFIALFAKMAGKNLIEEFHGYRYLEQIEEGKKHLRVITTKILDKLTLKLADHIVVVSPGIQAQLPPKYFNRSIVVQNSVDVTPFDEEFTEQEIANLREKYNIPPDKKTVGFVASGGKHLHIDDLIEFQEYIDNVYSVIICDLKRAPYLVEKTKHYSNVILTDLIPHREVVILLKHIIDISILPYNKDWYGSKVKNFFSSRKSSEYVDAGKPIIASDIPGIPSFLKEGVNYITYESKNPQQLAEKIKLLLDDRALYRRLSENNLKLVKEITWEQNIKKSGLLDIISDK